MNFLAYDSKFMITVRRITDHLLLGMLWVIASIPVITFGAAATSAMLTAQTVIHNVEGRLWRSFWQNFKKEFRQATVLWLIALVLLALLGLVVYILVVGEWPLAVQMLLTCSVVLVYCWMQLWFAYLSKFQDSLKTLLVNTVHMTLGSLPWLALLSLISLVILAGCAATVVILLPIMLLLPGVYLLLAMPIYRKIFGRYIPQDETEPEAE